MPFSEKLKLEMRRRSHFACCLCKALGVEIHHIVPQADGGGDTEENAAPLCPSCHETYGANPEKRKFIREARDLWFEICEKRFASDPERLNHLSESLKTVATKEDLERAVSELTGLFRDTLERSGGTPAQKAQEISEIGGMLSPGVGFNRHCKECNSFVGMLIGDQGRCPDCGTPW